MGPLNDAEFSPGQSITFDWNNVMGADEPVREHLAEQDRSRWHGRRVIDRSQTNPAAAELTAAGAAG